VSVLGGYAKADNSYWIVMTSVGYEFMIKFKPASETFSADRHTTDSTKSNKAKADLRREYNLRAMGIFH